ncbi:hypothetical protein H0H87_005929, partial [Tephrocybe sp. NHM501043]
AVPSARIEEKIKAARQEVEEDDSDIEMIDCQPVPSGGASDETMPAVLTPQDIQQVESSDFVQMTVDNSAIIPSTAPCVVELPPTSSTQDIDSEAPAATQNAFTNSSTVPSAYTNNIDAATERSLSSQPEDLDSEASAHYAPQERHQKLKKLIEMVRKPLKKKKALVTDTSTTNTLIDLEALSQYNDLHLKFSQKKTALQEKLKDCPRNAQHRVHLRMGKI